MQKSADLKVFNEKLVKPRNCDRGPDSPASAMPPVSPKKRERPGTTGSWVRGRFWYVSEVQKNHQFGSWDIIAHLHFCCGVFGGG